MLNDRVRAPYIVGCGVGMVCGRSGMPDWKPFYLQPAPAEVSDAIFGMAAQLPSRARVGNIWQIAFCFLLLMAHL